MDELLLRKVQALWKLSRYDPKCCEIFRRYEKLEAAFAEMAANLSEDDENLAWAFVCTSDELDRRLLEVICEHFCIDPVGYAAQLENADNG